ncbi:MAG: cell division protein FtsZ [Spirosomataceae bacterium]
MLYNQEFELDFKADFPHIIKVVGVGGAGGNAVRHMTKLGIHEVDFIACNTDNQVLNSLPDEVTKVQLGIELTKGLGAGAIPEMGRKAAEESEKTIRQLFLAPTEMVFITAGMGGGTGTGAAPVVARIAKEMNCLTVGVVTDPFGFEGTQKIEQAHAGIAELKKHCDTVLVIKNDRLADMFGDLDIEIAYSLADDVLANAVKSIAEVITRPGIINLDFADVKTVLGGAGQALMGSAEATGSDRAADAIKRALESPLLEENKIDGAKRILVTLAYSDEKPEYRIKMSDQKKVTSFIESQIASKAQIFKHGFAIDRSLKDKVRVTVVAAGFDAKFQVEVEASDPVSSSTKSPAVSSPSKPVAAEPEPTTPVAPAFEPISSGNLPELLSRIQATHDGKAVDFMALQSPAFRRFGVPLTRLNGASQQASLSVNLQEIYHELHKLRIV